MTPYNEEETRLINKGQGKAPYDEDQTNLINRGQGKAPYDENRTQRISKGSGKTPLWFWGLLGGGVLLSLVLLGLSWPQEEAGPPPPVQLSMPAREVGAPPIAPAASPLEELNTTAPADLIAREQALKYDVRKVDARPPPPKLRKKDPGIAPKRISRRITGKSGGSGVTNVKLVAMYQGKPVSAPVEVNGVWRGNTPLAVKLDAGSHAIRIDHGSTRVNEFVTSVTGGQNVRLEVELRPASEASGNGPSKYGKRHRH